MSLWDSANNKPYDATLSAGRVIGSSDKVVFNQSYVKGGDSSQIRVYSVINSSDVRFTGISANFYVYANYNSGTWAMSSLTFDNIATETNLWFRQYNATNGELSLSIAGDMNVKFGDERTDLYLGRIVSGGTSLGLRNLHVGGDLNISGRAFISINTLAKDCNGQLFTHANYAAASTQIDGVVNITGELAPVITLNYRSDGSFSANSITSVGGISGNRGTIMTAKSATYEVSSAALVFRNKSGTHTFAGNISETGSAMSMRLVMMGTVGPSRILLATPTPLSAA